MLLLFVLLQLLATAATSTTAAVTTASTATTTTDSAVEVWTLHSRWIHAHTQPEQTKAAFVLNRGWGGVHVRVRARVCMWARRGRVCMSMCLSPMWFCRSRFCLIKFKEWSAVRLASSAKLQNLPTSLHYNLISTGYQPAAGYNSR